MPSQAQSGLLAMILACMIWGLSPMFYVLLADVPPLEVLAHRTLWSLVFFVLLLGLRGQLGKIRDCLNSPTAVLLTVTAALMISSNWFGFIYSVQVGRAMESSLGYYIFPLVAVVLGLLVYRDRLRALQWIAVALAFGAVVVLTVGLHVVPLLSLMLALTFGIYGLVKKRLAADAMASVTAEVLVLAPLALVWLCGVHSAGWGAAEGRASAVFGNDPVLTLYLVLSGPLTASSLMLFSYASQRISLPTLGLAQYVNPTLQFLVAVFVFGEVFTPWHAIAFPMIWVALALYSYDGWQAFRTARKAPSALSSTKNIDVTDASANP